MGLCSEVVCRCVFEGSCCVSEEDVCVQKHVIAQCRWDVTVVMATREQIEDSEGKKLANAPCTDPSRAQRRSFCGGGVGAYVSISSRGALVWAGLQSRGRQKASST